MSIPAAWMQVLSLGILWTSVHCIGMCGPIMLGLSQHAPPTLAGRFRFVLRYQLGKAFVYVSIGGLLGTVGGESGALYRPFGWVMILVAMLLAFQAINVTKIPNVLYARPLLKLGLRPTVLQKPFFLGLLLSLLPCALVYWAFGLAAASGGTFYGAVTMALFTLVTTPTLLLAALAGKKLAGGKHSARIIQAVQLISAVWIFLIGLAALGAIDHYNTSFQVFGRPFGIMFF